MEQSEKNSKFKWFPGHMKSALDDIERDKIRLADAILYVLDSRAPFSCLNPNIKKIVHGKPVLYVFNKIDLADMRRVEEIKKEFEAQGNACVCVSANDFKCRAIVKAALSALLKDKLERAKQKGLRGTYKILVLGCPNTGKSSIINLLAGSKKAKAANTPGVTRANVWIKIDEDFILLDTPGVLWPKFDSGLSKNLAFIGCLSERELEVSDLGFELMQILYNKYPQNILERFDVDNKFDEFIEFYDRICIKRGYIMRRNEIDYTRAGKSFLDEFRAGKFGQITLE